MRTGRAATRVRLTTLCYRSQTSVAAVVRSSGREAPRRRAAAPTAQFAPSRWPASGVACGDRPSRHGGAVQGPGQSSRFSQERRHAELTPTPTTVIAVAMSTRASIQPATVSGNAVVRRRVSRSLGSSSVPQSASSKPPAPPHPASARPSARCCLRRCSRLAPSARRTAVSRCRLGRDEQQARYVRHRNQQQHARSSLQHP